MCCEVWAGNQTDVQSLLPVVDRLRDRFGIRRVCWVADRGMISGETIRELEKRGLEYILGARMRRQNEIREVVLGDPGPYEKMADNLEVKEVIVEGRRYVVCHNGTEAEKDAADRKAIVKALEDQLKNGGKSLVGNRGYQRFLKLERGAMSIDEAKVKGEERFDGKFVLRTNTALSNGEVALQYKRLQMVEQFFRALKSVLETRPIFHQWDMTITGHVFCSFLGLVLADELHRRVRARGGQEEWDVIRRDLEALAEVEVRQGDEWYLLRTSLVGVAGKVLQAVGVAVPPPIRSASVVVPKN